MPHVDAGAHDSLHHTSVEGGEDYAPESSSSQPPEEVEPLMCLSDVHTQVPVTVDNFHRRSSNVQGEVGMLAPSEVHNNLLRLLYIDAEVVFSAPMLQVFHLLPVAGLISVRDASNHCRVVRKLHNMTAWMERN
ncbi:uncharacterized protein LOC125801220 isoform X2 [Astyanax mexicanus]|uniref:uncharacterized protein LOC125801140 isoform X2 n=1 Tax=Astyanax mexicanus TaxID=7994 RepID=UPI0020CB0A2B|nr:uncharacterized protein LOC125801140 isoform X2 [Astyanax mexicanus]XP_049333554.1 uncharacterized protein LOC125801220 isoform X2 [Astyanax mexicanus]